jgi:acyl-CoA thioesterase II
MTIDMKTSKILAPGTAETFLNAVELTEVDAPNEQTRSFEAVTQYVPWPKAYGGDMVAQGLAAMMNTVGDDRSAHSTHSYFMRPVDIGAAVRYDVELLRDGRGYSTRQVRAFQEGKIVFISTGSFQVPVEEDHYAEPAPAVLAEVAPESLPSSAEALEGFEDDAARYWSEGRSFDMRHVEGPIYRGGVELQQPSQAIWIRAFDPLPASENPKAEADLHRIGLAYLCDYTILESLLRQRGLSWGTEGLVTASLDHSMWFHRPGRVDDWILYVQEAVSSQSQRGLATGNFYSREGDLLATVAQEGMIRA